MGSSEPGTQHSSGRPLVRARAIGFFRTALETAATPQPEVSTQQADLETDAPTAWLETAATPQPEVSTQQADLETERPIPDIRRDVAVAMNLARKAVAIAAKAAEDDLRNMRELLESAEARAKGAEERAELAEARVAETEKLLADIRDHITAKVAHLCGA
jgi:pyruvate/2-oxoglutarate dehydrogenase complex dihydrolipoamide acyltransferase (E2) component